MRIGRWSDGSPAVLLVEMLRIPLIIVAEVFVNFATRRVVVIHGLPRDIPAAAPGSCVGSFIVDRHLVPQAIVFHPGEAFGEVKITGMRQTASDHPEPLVETYGVYHERVSLPPAD